MSNNLAVVQNDAFTDERIRLIRNQTAPDAPPEVFAAMIDIARRRGLDPLAKQISVLNFSGKWQVMTTIDGYRSLAEQTGVYAGSDEPVFEGEPGRPTSATVTVYKMVAGQRCPFTAKVFMAEYRGPGPIWANKPYTMLGKVAESHALRKAFPSVMSGLYTSEEMDQARDDAPQAPQRPRSAPQSRIEVIDNLTGEITPADDNVEGAYMAAQRERRIEGQSPRFAANAPQPISDRTMKAIHAYAKDNFTILDGNTGLPVPWGHAQVSAYCKGTYGVSSMTELTEEQGAQVLRTFNMTMKHESDDLLEAAADAAYARIGQ